MTTQETHIKTLKSLHVKGDPLILFNIWDAGSAQTIEKTGAKAIATSSWAVAAAHGYDDGEKLPLDLVLANIKRIVASVDLPVTIDLEAGYCEKPIDLQKIIEQVIATGVAGINFEDQIIGSNTLYSLDDQCARIRAIRTAAEQAGMSIFINARTDIFFQIDPASHNNMHLEEAIHRASAYANAGANGFFAPGLSNKNLIKILCDRSPIPVNIMVQSRYHSADALAFLGVSRISHGPRPYSLAMSTLSEAGLEAF